MENIIKEQLEEVIKKNLPERKCEFEPDGEFHSCYNGCEGTVQNCRKCHRDICSNKLCPNGKADTLYPYGFNQALSQIDTTLIADEVLKVVVEIGEKLKFNHKEGSCYKCYCKIYDSAINDLLNLLTNSSTPEGEQSEHLSPNKENTDTDSGIFPTEEEILEQNLYYEGI